MDLEALFLTLRLAVVTTGILLLIGVPLGYWIARSTSHAGHLAQAVVALPLMLPPTVLGFYLLVFLGPNSASGRFLSRIFGHTLAFSFTGLVIGSVLYSFPFAVQPVVAGFTAVHREYAEAARLLGATWPRVLWRIFLPLSRRSILTAVVLAFTHTVGEFGVVLMLGGGIPGRTRTLSISIYDQVQDFQYTAANRTSLLLLAFAFLALLAVYTQQERTHS